MQITVLASLAALMLSLPIHGLPHSTAIEILTRVPTIPSSPAVKARTATVGNAKIPHRRHAAPLGSICREHADEYAEYCDWVDPADEGEEDDSITDDQLSNDDTGYNAR